MGAYGHGGLADDAFLLYSSLKPLDMMTVAGTKSGILVRLVESLARSGRLNEAEDIALGMTGLRGQPYAMYLVLVGCRLHKDVALARRVSQRLLSLPDSTLPQLLAGLSAEVGVVSAEGGAAMTSVFDRFRAPLAHRSSEHKQPLAVLVVPNSRLAFGESNYASRSQQDDCASEEEWSVSNATPADYVPQRAIVEAASEADTLLGEAARRGWFAPDRAAEFLSRARGHSLDPADARLVPFLSAQDLPEVLAVAHALRTGPEDYLARRILVLKRHHGISQNGHAAIAAMSRLERVKIVVKDVFRHHCFKDGKCSDMESLWKAKAFINLVLESTSITGTSPLSGSVVLEVVGQVDAPQGVTVRLMGTLLMSWLNSDTTTATNSGGILVSAVSVAANVVGAAARASRPTDSLPSYNSIDQLATQDARRASSRKVIWSHDIYVAPPQTFVPGSYSFELNYAPPRDLIPPFSFSGVGMASCELIYTASAIVPQSIWARSIRSPAVTFMPQPPPLDARSDPALECVRRSGFLFGRQGETVSVTLRSPRSAYAAGDDTGYFLCHVSNGSSRDMNELRLELVQRVVLDAGRNARKSIRKVLHKASFPGVRPGELGQKILRIEIPSCAPTIKMPGISITYEVSLSAIMNFSLSEVKTSSPIMIVSSGQGIMLSEATQQEEEQLSAARMPVATTVSANTEIALEPLEMEPRLSPSELITRSEQLMNGSRLLVDDVWQNGSLSFQGFDLYYYDVSAATTSADTDIPDSNQPEFESSESSEGPDVIDSSTSTSRVRNLIGAPTVVVVSDSDVGLRISKDTVPTWWSYQLREESRSLEADSSQESYARLSLGPGRYYISIYGNTLSRSANYRLMVTAVGGIGAILQLHSDKTNPLTEAEILGTWVTTRGNEIPPDAWQAGNDLGGEPLFVARAWVGGGLHIGKVGAHFRSAVIPYGGEEREVTGDYEVLCGAPAQGRVRWVRQLGGGVPPNAVPGGNESDGRLLYIGRASMAEPRAWPLSLAGVGRTSMCPGKCGAHLPTGCNVPFDGREVHASPFEVLVYEGVGPVRPGPGSSGVDSERRSGGGELLADS
ncbi:hypothetical protein HK405_006531 [Cladochytrium tenue]|nr:hypothetical protein HK405_006531 [Cladochytrium tenue]